MQLAVNAQAVGLAGARRIGARENGHAGAVERTYGGFPMREA